MRDLVPSISAFLMKDAPVIPGLWWIILLAAYNIWTGDDFHWLMNYFSDPEVSDFPSALLFCSRHRLESRNGKLSSHPSFILSLI